MKGLFVIVSLLSLPAWAAQTTRACKVVLTWSAPATSPVPVTGYNVYRADLNRQAFARLNAQPIITTSYTDDTVRCGEAHTYYVVSVDVHGNESGPSPYWSVPTPIERTHIPWFRQHRRRALLLLIFIMFAGIVGIVAIWIYAARTGRPHSAEPR